MSTRKTASGNYHAQVKVGSGPKALRDSGTFSTLRQANEWRERRRVELKQEWKELSGEVSAGERKTLQDALRKYAEDVSPTHKGERWEQVRLAMFEKDTNLPVSLPLARVTPQHINRWRDARLTKVSPDSVRREMSLLGSVFTHARVDWGWIKHSPLADVRRPKASKPKNRIIHWHEVKRLLRQLGYRQGQRPQSVKQMVAYALMIALRTGMRAGEVTSARWEHTHDRYITLVDTKNGDRRDVPLSAKAQRLISSLRGLDEERVLPITTQSLDALFRKARGDAGLEGFTFHSSRHSAATWIGRQVGKPGRLSFPEFCVAFGWRDPKNAMIYVNPSAAELALKL